MKAPEHLKKNIFKAPEGYFDTLPDRVKERVRAEDAKPTTTKFMGLPGWSYAAAASVIVLLLAGIYFYQQPNESLGTEEQIARLLSEVPSETILDYLQTDAEIDLAQLSLTEDEQEELLLQKLDTYEIPIETYDYDIYELEEYL